MFLRSAPSLVMILMLFSTPGLWAKKPVTDLLTPGTMIAGAEVTDREIIETRQQMYDYMDGGAELYFDHGWDWLVAADLMLQDRREFKAEVYRVASHQEALELLVSQMLLSSRALGDTAAVGDASYYGAGMVMWVQDDFYVKVWSLDVYDAVRNDVTALALGLADRLKEFR